MSEHKVIFLMSKIKNSNNDKIPQFVTRYKKERNEFYLKNGSPFFHNPQKITSEQINWVLESKKKDEELRVSLGIK